MRKILFAFVCLAALGISACTSTRAVIEWRDNAFAGGPFHNMLIIGMSRDVTARRAYEDTFVKSLAEVKVGALSSASVIPPGVKISRESVSAAIAGKNIDSVLVTRLVGVQQKEIYHPPTYTPAPYSYGLYGYYGHVSFMYEPGYVSTHELVRLESNLYDVKTEKLVWSTQTETMDPGSTTQLVNEKIKTVIAQLRKQKLI